MTISDIVIIVIVVCVGLTGFIKGIKKSTGSFVKFALALAGAFFLAKLAANKLLSVDFVARSVAGNNSLFGFLRSLLPERLDYITTASLLEQTEGLSSVQALENVRTFLTANGLSGTFMSIGFMLFGHALINPVYLNSSLPTATDIIALELSYALFCIIVFFTLFIVFRLLLALLGKMVKPKEEGKKRFFLRFGALFLGAAKGACYAMLLFCIIAVLSPLSFMNVVNKDIERSDISRPLLNTSATITAKIIESPATDSRYKKLIKIANYDL